MRNRKREEGAILLLATALLAGLLLALVGMEVAATQATLQRERWTERSLAQAREALVAYAADRPIDDAVGPGYLPCPDLDNDGWAEGICGSLDGATGQPERLGRLPWKTLGLPDLRDGEGERLWYAVSTKAKGLLHCAASRDCLDMSPARLLGTITLRDASGAVLHDGRIADAERGGALAVVIAPGAALHRGEEGQASRPQQRECAPPDCAADGRCVDTPARRAPRCDPANYLEAARGEDNADFVDRYDAAGRGGNGNGFIQGPVRTDRGDLALNDRVAAVTWGDLMPRVMQRVALEASHCLRFYASRPENAGRLPWAASCSPGVGDPAWRDVAGTVVGRVPDTPFAATRASSGDRMLERWWRAHRRHPEALDELPTAQGACRIAMLPFDAGPQRRSPPAVPVDEATSAPAPSWWHAWRPHVTFAVAPSRTPEAFAPHCGASGACMASDTRERAEAHFAVVVTVSPTCAAHRFECQAAGCTRLLVPRAWPPEAAVLVP